MLLSACLKCILVYLECLLEEKDLFLQQSCQAQDDIGHKLKTLRESFNIQYKGFVTHFAVGSKGCADWRKKSWHSRRISWVLSDQENLLSQSVLMLKEYSLFQVTFGTSVNRKEFDFMAIELIVKTNTKVKLINSRQNSLKE